MRLLYLGKYSTGAVRVGLYYDAAESVVVSVVADGSSAVVQAYKKLSLVPSHLRKGIDLTQLHSLLSSSSSSLEFFTTAPARDLVEAYEPLTNQKAGWLEYGLKKIEGELRREKETYLRFRGVRDLSEAKGNLGERRDEIFDLEQKLIANAKEPQLVYNPGPWVPSAWQATDRVRFRELRDQAQIRASALKQRIDFTHRMRIKELEAKKRDLEDELEAEKKREKDHEASITRLVDESEATVLLLTVRSRPTLVSGRLRPAVFAAYHDAVNEARRLATKLNERLGLRFKEADDWLVLSSLFIPNPAQLGSAMPALSTAIERFLGLSPKDAHQKAVAKAVASLLAGTAPSPNQPDLSRFPTGKGTARRLAFLGLALDDNLQPTPFPVFYDLDEQGPRHTQIAGGSGSGKSVAASLIVEAAALHGIPCLVLDPTRSWTGFIQACTSESSLCLFDSFHMKREWARGFNVRLIELERGSFRPPSFEDVLSHPGITIVNPTDLTEEQEAALLSGLLKRVAAQIKEWPESKTLKLLIVLEEAHRYLQSKDLEQHLELFARTARVRGVGLLVLSQNSVDVPPAIRNNCATKIQLHTNYAQDLTRVGQVFGTAFQKQIPRLERGTGALFYPEYGQVLVSFRPPLHSPQAVSEPVATYYAALKDLEGILATLLARQNPEPTPAHLQTPAEGPTEAQKPQTTQDWRAVATHVASTKQKPAASIVHEAILEAGIQPPSLRTIQRFLKSEKLGYKNN